MADKTRYMNQQEKEEAKVMFAGGLTIFQVALKMNRSHHAIRRVVTQPEVQAEIHDIRERLINKYQTAAENCVDKLLEPGTIDKASPRDLATISGIAVDKARLLADQSTQNLAIRSQAANPFLFDPKTAARIAEIMATTLSLPDIEAEKDEKVRK
jgi:hypothetical protein